MIEDEKFEVCPHCGCEEFAVETTWSDHGRHRHRKCFDCNSYYNGEVIDKTPRGEVRHRCAAEEILGAIALTCVLGINACLWMVM